jgi:hypothetical protein
VSRPTLPRRVKPGDAITAGAFNAILDELVRLGSVRVGGGLSMRMGPGGLAITGGAAAIVAIFPGVATAQITARATNTVGSGTYKLRTLSGTTLSDGTTGLDIRSNFSAAVASGKAIMVGRDEDGVDWLLGADCP